MPSKRMPDNVLHNLQDILDETAAASRHWTIAMDRAEKSLDISLINALARLRDNLAIIERKATDAVRVEYRQ